jgi:hypothetical protein
MTCIYYEIWDKIVFHAVFNNTEQNNILCPDLEHFLSKTGKKIGAYPNMFWRWHFERRTMFQTQSN